MITKKREAKYEAKGKLKATVSEQHTLLLKVSVAVFPDDIATPAQAAVTPSVPKNWIGMAASAAASVPPMVNVPPEAPPLFYFPTYYVADSFGPGGNYYGPNVHSQQHYGPDAGYPPPRLAGRK